jgi:hypothetical protein
MGSGSDRPATGSRSAADRVDDDDHQDRADHGHDDRAEVERPVDRVVLKSRLARKPPTRAPTMPSTIWPMTPRPSSPLHEEAGEVAGDRAEHDPGDDAHEVWPPSLDVSICP